MSSVVKVSYFQEKYSMFMLMRYGRVGWMWSSVQMFTDHISQAHSAMTEIVETRSRVQLVSPEWRVDESLASVSIQRSDWSVSHTSSPLIGWQTHVTGYWAVIGWELQRSHRPVTRLCHSRVTRHHHRTAAAQAQFFSTNFCQLQASSWSVGKLMIDWIIN